MNILDLLAKLGILRYGAKAGVYKTAADRPAELMMPGVFDAERDLVRGREPKKDDDRRPPK